MLLKVLKGLHLVETLKVLKGLHLLEPLKVLKGLHLEETLDSKNKSNPHIIIFRCEA